ncbi:L-gulonolactone/D-arabinono-1,4-lactone oxidase [Laetiporus sulphureus 93-53]|uniref:D-arabinono-1,4-lactone oxidase n=1 Tax=Laetiporus sulphureus 93-53 TaxID=1314785 RepID=A0A165DMW1_9APHY|nr:L-gulonolactone/D-arabinono-1,4-lactone oxidase [Laetiporus sulphureus 93-53]KZT05230.1 L-gulonolactone/D-arabinono-1,4-lactone oxidase [Laetiporus sulphureus 93-53]
MAPSSPAITSTLADLPLQALYARLQPITVPAGHPRATFINWGLSYACTPLAVFEPETEQQCELVFELARREGRTVRAAGVGHSPSDLACTSGYMLRTEKLNKIIEVNAEKKYVVAHGGITLQALHAELAANNLAMINLGSISDQTLAGMVTTATHGSGIAFQVLSTHVMSLTLLLPNGSRVRCSRQDNADLFMASLCGLGSTGLILQVQLEVTDAFRLKETQESIAFDEVIRNLDPIVHSAEHVRLWWFPQAGVVRVSAANRAAEVNAFLCMKPVDTWLWHSLVGYHLLQFLFFLGRYITSLNPWIGRFGAWLVSDKTVGINDSHRIFNIDCKYPQYTTEWAIPYENTRACLSELRAWLDEEAASPTGLRPHFPVEIRFTAADDVWLSPSNGGKTCWIGLVQYKPYGLNVPYRKLFSHFEEIMARHNGRPHWAKAHHLRPDGLRKLYPRFDDFVKVLQEVDPNGMLRNEYVERHLFGKKGREYDERVFKRAH